MKKFCTIVKLPPKCVTPEASSKLPCVQDSDGNVIVAESVTDASTLKNNLTCVMCESQVSFVPTHKRQLNGQIVSVRNYFRHTGTIDDNKCKHSGETYMHQAAKKMVQLHKPVFTTHCKTCNADIPVDIYSSLSNSIDKKHIEGILECTVPDCSYRFDVGFFCNETPSAEETSTPILSTDLTTTSSSAITTTSNTSTTTKILCGIVEILQTSKISKEKEEWLQASAIPWVEARASIIVDEINNSITMDKNNCANIHISCVQSSVNCNICSQCALDAETQFEKIAKLNYRAMLSKANALTNIHREKYEQLQKNIVACETLYSELFPTRAKIKEYDPFLTFGKHKGKQLSTVYAKDKSYIVWLERCHMVEFVLLAQKILGSKCRGCFEEIPDYNGYFKFCRSCYHNQ